MNLCVAVRMNQQTIFCVVCSTQRFVDDVVAVPSGHLGDRLVTDRAAPVLLTPQVRQHPFSSQVILHLYAQAFFQIDFPCWVIRIAVTLDFDVPPAGCCISQAEQVFILLALVVFAFAEETPTLIAVVPKVFILDPPVVLVGVSSARPSPQCLEASRIHIDKGFVADDMAMKVCPASYFGVEQGYQRICRGLFVCLDDIPDVRHERFHVLLRWLGEKLAIVFPDVLSQKVKSPFDVRNGGLLFREFQSSFAEKCRNERFDFLFQNLLRDARNDEVIRIAHQIYTFNLALSGFVAMGSWAVLLRSIGSSPSRAMLARTGEMMPPCGVPSVVL